MKRIIAPLLIISLLILGSFAQPYGKYKDGALALINVTVIDATGAEPKPRMTVVINGDRIAQIGETGRVKIPKGAQVINAEGKFLIPGLWDMHVHLAKAGEHTLPLFIANGVTGVRDMGGDFQIVLAWRREIQAGTRLGPRIKTAGPILESARHVEGMKQRTIEPVERTRIGIAGPDAAAAAIASVAKLGVDFLKIRTVASVETYRAIAAAAKEHKLALAGHAAAPPEELIRAGQRSIEHSFFPPLDNLTDAQRTELFRRMAASDIVVVPTLITGEGSLRVPLEKAAAIVEDGRGTLDGRRKYLAGYLIEDWREQVRERNQYPVELNRPVSRPHRDSDLRAMHKAGVRHRRGRCADLSGLQLA